MRDLSKYLSISAFLNQFCLIACSGLIVEHQQLFEGLYALIVVFLEQLIILLHLLRGVCVCWCGFLCLFCFLLLFLTGFCLVFIPICFPLRVLLLILGGRVRLHELLSFLQPLLLRLYMLEDQIKIGLAGVDLIQIVNFFHGIEVFVFGLEFEAVEVVPVGGAEASGIHVVGETDGLRFDLLLAGSAEGTASWGVGCLDGLAVGGLVHERQILINTYQMLVWGCYINSDIISPSLRVGMVEIHCIKWGKPNLQGISQRENEDFERSSWL